MPGGSNVIPMFPTADRQESQREKRVDATLLALKSRWRPPTAECKQPPGTEKDEQVAPEGAQLCHHLGFRDF